VRVFAVLSLLFATLAVSCFDCRPVETRPLALDCAAAATFRGELHLDSAETFRSFLSDRCLTEATATEIDAVVAGVDFTTEAVFVARGARGSIARCLESRVTESVDVCGDGLKVIFEDEESGDDVCPGDWTIAFALQRADLRAALDD
jgi:hypothetical protein